MYSHHHHSSADRFVEAAGGAPRYLLWAEDVLVSSPTTWKARYSVASASLVGSVVVDNVGFNQRKALLFDNDYINLDTILGSVQSGQERTIMLAIRLESSATFRALVSDSQSTGTVNTMVKFVVDDADFGTLTKSTVVSGSSSKIPEGAPIILTIRTNGTSCVVRMRKRGVDTTILTDTVAETTNVHNQHTLFAHRFQSTVTQYMPVKARLAIEWNRALSDQQILDVLDLVEDQGFFNCPTIEEPEVLLEFETTVRPHILFYTPDLANEVDTYPTTIPNRGIGPDGISVEYPTSRPRVVMSYNDIPALQCRGDGYLNFSSSIDGSWGGYGSSELVLLAFQWGSTILQNQRLLDYESSVANGLIPPQRVIESRDADFRSSQVVGNGVVESVSTTSTTIKNDSRYVLVYHRTSAGAVTLVVRSRTTKGIYSEIVVTGTQATTVLTAITGVFFGGVNRPSSGGQLAFDVGDLVFSSIHRGTPTFTTEQLKGFASLIESENGLNLPMGEQINQLDSVPQPTALMFWMNARLQGALATVDDMSSFGNDGVKTGAVTVADDRFDFNSSPTNYITPTPSVVIPSGSGALACVAIVSRKAGLGWTSSNAYNIASANGVGSVAFYIVGSAGVLQLAIFWNSTAYFTSVSVAGWAVDVDHTVAFSFDGTVARVWVDDPSTVLFTSAALPARSTIRQLQVGAFGNANGWSGHMRTVAYWVGASLMGVGEMQKAFTAMYMQMVRFYCTGDSNTDPRVDVAPAGAGTWSYQIPDMFAAEGWLTERAYNDGISGSCWNNPTPIAPQTMIQRGVLLDALVPLGACAVLMVSTHTTNDVNYFGQSVATIQANITTYVNARRASGKWKKIFFCEVIPQTRNPTNQAKIDAINAWLASQVGVLIDGLVLLPLAIKNSTDVTYYIPNTSPSIAEHLNATGSKVLAQAITDYFKTVRWT